MQDYYNREDMKALVKMLECNWIKSFSDDPKAIMSFSSSTVSPTSMIWWWKKNEYQAFVDQSLKANLIRSSAGQKRIKNVHH